MSGEEGQEISAAATHARRARSFGSHAEEYDRWRPGYPDAAVDWLLPPGGRDVLDVGAGTGKLTGALVRRGLRVVAVDPDAEMLAVLARRHPTAEARVAAADALPLPDTSVDAVLVAQAWHWFPHEKAVAEVRRVLRPGGWLGLVWNQASPEEPWQVEVERLNAATRGYSLEARLELPEVIEVEGLPGDRLEAALFHWEEQLHPAHVRRRLATYSYVALLPEAEREAVLDEAAALVGREAARRGGSTVPFRQAAYCVRWRPES